jgi:putative NADH-flavin reductase
MSKQKMAIFGALGKTGNTITTEALKRKFKVTAIVYDVTKVSVRHPNLDVKWGHMINPTDIKNLVKGHDFVVGIHEPLNTNPDEHIRSIQSVVEGTKNAGIKHLILIGHPINKPIENTMEFYDLWKPIAKAQKEGLKILKKEFSLNWGYVYSPELEPDLRTGKLRFKGDMILTTKRSEYRIPLNNYASSFFNVMEEKDPIYKEEFEYSLLK